MTEEKNKSVPYLVTIIVILVAILAFILGRASVSGFGRFGHMGMMNDGRVTVPEDFDRRGMMDHNGMMGGAGAGALSGADVMFLQMMIPHHQQAVDMANLAVTRSTNQKLLSIANAIKSGQTAEIAEMGAWLSDNGATELPDASGHHMGGMGMGMGGMLSDTEMSALAAATGAEFDRLWLHGMIQHHEGALHMVMMIDDSDNPELRAFADRITKVQTAEIAEMNALL
jgi:uncharacterized protein (DUF305 family)